jgi:hypothetical protein
MRILSIFVSLLLSGENACAARPRQSTLRLCTVMCHFMPLPPQFYRFGEDETLLTVTFLLSFDSTTKV